MSLYRIYVLTAQERIARTLETEFATDRAALARAEAIGGGCYAAEVWDGERLVGRLGSEFSLAEDWAAERWITSGS